MRNLSTAVLQKWMFYCSVILGVTVLFSFQNCGKVKFNSVRQQELVVPQSCGSISMTPANGLYADTSVAFQVTPPDGITITNLSWDFTKGGNSIFSSTVNPVSHQFNGSTEGGGDYVATAIFMKSDGNGCELTKSFQILVGDLCQAPSGISGPAVGFAGEETSPFSVDAEACFNGTVVWDMDGDGIAEYNVGVIDQITHIYITPGTYTIKATVINAEDNSQTILTHTIEIKYPNCTNGAINPPVCDQCAPGNSMVNGQCIANCANGAIDPPTCVNCPAGKTLVGGQCVDNCTNGTNNPPTCTQCPTGTSMSNNQCVGNCTNGATNPPTCNQCPAGQIRYNNQCVPGTCALPWGGTINHGESVPASQSSTVPFGSACNTQTRTCTAGVLSGTFTNKTCTVQPPANCTLPWGGTLAHGQSTTGYAAPNVGFGGACTSQTRTCNNGVLSGSYGYGSCAVNPPANCSWNGQAYGHGAQVTGYAAPSVPYGQACAAETRTCNNGSWSGSYGYASCSPAAPPPPPPITSQCGIYIRIACFVGGTKVSMADGTSKNIEDVGIGEMVKTFDESSGKVTVSPVEEVFHHEETLSELHTFNLSDGTKLTSNDIHLIYVDNVKNYLSAKDIYQVYRTGSPVRLMKDNKKIVTIQSMSVKTDKVKLYNLHVTSPYDRNGRTSQYGHNYYANDVLVHNEKAQSTICNAVGLEENGDSSCFQNKPISGSIVTCCQNNGGRVDINPSYPRGDYCESVQNCAAFLTCPGNGVRTCTSETCSNTSAACRNRGGGVSYGGGCKCNDGFITSCPNANL